ncbi:MAG: aldo/keto reductase [Desulfobacteraceae bacterium]|jgi:predicted aldo/keto reductase-like oxidoreductase|nr:aldo/keto reductase [Desulfobacteraceae bacterium]
MLYREVPKNGDKLSVLGYGCMRLPVRMKSINEKLAEKQILYAMEQGVNYFDTAYPYHNGKSEPFLGKVLSKNGCRDEVKIATKLPHWMAQSKADMDKILDEQLAKLKTDRIDYYLIHALNGELWETAKHNGVIAFMDDALKKGKIINAGFSFHGLAEDFNGIVDDYDWTFCQIQYNYLDTRNQAGTAGLEYAASKNLAVIIMEPLRGGNLAKTPPPSVQDIWARADHRKTPVEWSLGWIWNHPEVTVVLSGMNNDDHINENLALAEKALPNAFSEDEIKLVEDAAVEFRRAMKVGCTGCQYCMPCPAGVNIPSCFECYNSKHAFKDKSAKMMYLFQNGGMVTEKVSMASMCVQCGQCLEKCPQNLPIPDLLKDVQEDLEGFMTKQLIWLGRRIMKVRKKKNR